VTSLPDSVLLRDVFGRIDELLASYASRGADEAHTNVVEAGARFK
jgi:hypothetical protein